MTYITNFIPESRPPHSSACCSRPLDLFLLSPFSFPLTHFRRLRAASRRGWIVNQGYTASGGRSNFWHIWRMVLLFIVFSLFVRCAEQALEG